MRKACPIALRLHRKLSRDVDWTWWECLFFYYPTKTERSWSQRTQTKLLSASQMSSSFWPPVYMALVLIAINRYFQLTLLKGVHQTPLYNLTDTICPLGSPYTRLSTLVSGPTLIATKPPFVTFKNCWSHRKQVAEEFRYVQYVVEFSSLGCSSPKKHAHM